MLPPYPSILLFLLATVILNILPGTDVLYIASQSLVNKRQGVLATLGVSTGIGVYIITTSFGLAGILHQSHFAFELIKIVGAAYLLYLAYLAFTKKQPQQIIQSDQIVKNHSAYYKGICTTLLNPKVGIFFLTFLPQFVDPNRGKVWLQLLLLGGCFIVSATFVNLMYAFLFTQLKDKLFSKMRLQRWFNKITGLLFCAIALKIVTEKQG